MRWREAGSSCPRLSVSAGLRLAGGVLLGGLRLRTRLEHVEHPVGDEEAADDVDRAEGDRDHEQRLAEGVQFGEPEQQQAAEQHDPVDRVGAAHQRRVQRVGHLGDHDETDEAREHEDREVRRQYACQHHPSSPPLPPSPTVGPLVVVDVSSTAALAPGFTISPSRTMQAPATISSSKSSFSSTSPSAPPSLAATSRSSSASTLRANICEECSAMLAGRFKGETIFTSCLTTVWPGSVSSQLPPDSPAKSTITEPGFMPRTASAVTNLGAGRPGTSAVVMTTSKPLIASGSACCCCARSCSVSSRA